MVLIRHKTHVQLRFRVIHRGACTIQGSHKAHDECAIRGFLDTRGAYRMQGLHEAQRACAVTGSNIYNSGFS